MYKKTTLKSGLRIVTHYMPKMQSVAVGIWIKVGGRYESEGNKGIAHFLEHLIFKGTKNYSCRQIKESIEGVGGSLNGFTSEEATCYLAKLPASSLERAAHILADMVIAPTMPDRELQKERTVILEEIKMYKDLPHSYVYELLDELLWPGQPLGMSIIGSEESVNSLTRQDVHSFKMRYYTPRNIVVSAAGRVEHARFASCVEKLFSGLQEKGINTFQAAKESQAKPQLKLLHKETEQTHLALGLYGFKREHPLKHAISLLHIILGGNMSSRLFNEIRESRGLAYEIGTQIKRFQDTGAFIVHAGIDNRKIDSAISLILKELKKTADELVSPQEFKRAEEFYLGQLMLALEDTLDHMLWIGESTVALDKTQTVRQVIDEVKSIRRPDIRDAARRIFRENSLNLALIGPLKDREQSIYRQLHL